MICNVSGRYDNEFRAKKKGRKNMEKEERQIHHDQNMVFPNQNISPTNRKRNNISVNYVEKIIRDCKLPGQETIEINLFLLTGPKQYYESEAKSTQRGRRVGGVGVWEESVGGVGV